MFISSLAHATDLALVGAKIYTAPTAPPIENGSVVLHDGKIAAVGPSHAIPKKATVIDCKGMVVTAGFWNSHVHILPPGLLHAEKQPAQEINSQLEEMFTKWGFTTVFDIASVLQNTSLIRHRIQTGEIQGPRIFTVGEPFWEKGGTPFYVKSYFEQNHINIPEVESAAGAKQRVRQQIADGADAIKIFANSVERNNGTLTMPLELAQAIVSEAHAEHKLVFAHVANDEGIQVALKSGVDILAHTTPNGSFWSASLVQQMISTHTSLTPTLTLWDEELRGYAPPEQVKQWMRKAADQLHTFSKAGGQVLFGTDIGYIQHYDTSEEFTWMTRAGMSFPQILASLTTNPARRFGYSAHSGRIAKGMDADLVVLNADPAKDITALSNVRYTIREGKIIYSEK